jgi:hypothetical protein
VWQRKAIFDWLKAHAANLMDEHILKTKQQTKLQTVQSVLFLARPDYLKSLVGAPGLEPGTR